MSVLVRRDFLRAIAAVASPGALAACADANPLEIPGSTLEDGAPYFPQSVASGDPRPDSVVLWTRVADPDHRGEDLSLVLELSADQDFRRRVPLGEPATPELAVTARADADGCVKMRVSGLEPDQVYYYRFSYLRAATRYRSRVGRTRTAPSPDSERPLTFAVLSCQDYAGKFYHAHRDASRHDLDFFLHLGDYVYETSDDPAFQTPTAERRVLFSRPEAALDRGEGRLAARSLDNYRDLYQIYRSDPDLQRLHETAPMIAVPDDHEFSNDCHGASSTYADGRENELDLERRRNADQAWFEFMPFDDGVEPARSFDPARTFPDDLRLYRAFTFGRHLELVMTDLRRYRPDHVVPEDAFPGSLLLSETQLSSVLGAVPSDAVRYLDLDAPAHAELRDALAVHASAQGFDPARVRGLLSVPWINGVFVVAGEAPPLDEASPELPRGYAVHQLLKSAEFSSAGARYLVAEAPFLAYAKLRAQETEGASERLMGDAQRRWFLDTLRASTRTWKVWGNEVTLMARVIDLTEISFAPPEFQQRVLIVAEDWDGAPNERDALLAELASVKNVVVFTGDLHAFFAGTPHPAGDPGARVVEFVSGSASSTTWLTGIERVIASDPSIPAGASLLASLVGTLLQHPDSKPNPHIGWLELKRNGYALARASADELEVTLFTIDDTDVAAPPPAPPADVADLFSAMRFRVRSGTRDLERLVEGTWRVWDRDTQSWQ